MMINTVDKCMKNDNFQRNQIITDDCIYIIDMSTKYNLFFI